METKQDSVDNIFAVSQWYSPVWVCESEKKEREMLVFLGESEVRMLTLKCYLG